MGCPSPGFPRREDRVIRCLVRRDRVRGLLRRVHQPHLAMAGEDQLANRSRAVGERPNHLDKRGEARNGFSAAGPAESISCVHLANCANDFALAPWHVYDGIESRGLGMKDRGEVRIAEADPGAPQDGPGVRILGPKFVECTDCSPNRQAPVDEEHIDWGSMRNRKDILNTGATSHGLDIGLARQNRCHEFKAGLDVVEDSDPDGGLETFAHGASSIPQNMPDE